MHTEYERAARVFQRAVSAAVFLAVACASDGERPGFGLAGNQRTGEDSGSEGAGPAGDAGATAADSAVPTAAGRLYHARGDKWDPTSLELKNDGTFRWAVHGCDFFGGDIGRWTAENGATVLHPRTDRDEFRWPGDGSIESVASVVLRPNGGGGFNTDLVTESGTVPQSWDPGGRCAQCGGGDVPDGSIQLGPSGTYDCDDPFMGTTIDY